MQSKYIRFFFFLCQDTITKWLCAHLSSVSVFILVRVLEDPEQILGTLGLRGEYIQDETAVHHFMSS